MANFDGPSIRTEADLARFESAMTLEARLPERSVLDVFEAAASRHPDRTAITMLMTGAADEVARRVSYGQLLVLVRQAANLFRSGQSGRSAVAYMLPNLVETHVTLWGAEAAGHAVPVNFLLTVESIASLLKASGVSVLVALGPHPVLDIWQKAMALRERLPGLKLLRVGGGAMPLEEGVLDFHAELAKQPSDHLVFGEAGRDDEVAAYFHTGGTTGAPRLVAHTHRGQLVAAFGGAVLGGIESIDTVTATLPLFHAGGTIICGLSVFIAGAGMLIMSPVGLRNPAMVNGFWRLVSQYRATLVGGVPTSLSALLEAPLEGCDLSAVKAGLCGASSLPLATGERFRALTGLGLYEIYGMTEASGLISIDPPNGSGSPGSVGWSIPYCKLEVRRNGADGQLGPVCDPGEIGVVTTRGPHVSPGYLDSAHDAGVFEQGVLVSGDLGYLDEAGRLHLSGRAKDLIIRSGHNIDPSMIENAMAMHPAVALSAAVGMPDAYAGEVPVCYVSLRPGATVTVDDLLDHARKVISERPAWPKEVVVLDAIPMTSVGKIYKPQLRCDAAERVVRRLLREEANSYDAKVRVSEEGPRGLRVCVDLPRVSVDVLPRLRTRLGAYSFEAVLGVE